MNGTREAILDCLGTLPDRPDPAVETISSTTADVRSSAYDWLDRWLEP